MQIAPLGASSLAAPGGDAPVGLEPVGAAVEREIRIVTRHFRREALDLTAAGDVRGVGDDEVELAIERVEPIRGEEGGAVGDPEAPRISFCKTKRRKARIGAKATRLRQLGEKRQKDAPRPRAEIEQAKRLFPPPSCR